MKEYESATVERFMAITSRIIFRCRGLKAPVPSRRTGAAGKGNNATASSFLSACITIMHEGSRSFVGLKHKSKHLSPLA